MSTIKVISVRGMPANAPGVTYVGRGCNGWAASALGNPYSQGTREENIASFKRDLWAAMQAGQANTKMTKWQERAWCAMLRLLDAYRYDGDLKLGCWCNPLACHADVIKAAILWLDKQPDGLTELFKPAQ